MNKATQGCFFVWVCIAVTLSGCSRTQGDDSSPQAVFPFDESITLGDSQGNPADPYLATSDEGQVFVSWTEDVSDGKGRNVFIAKVTNGGQQVAEIRQANQEPTSATMENLFKFAIAPGENVTAIFNTFASDYSSMGNMSGGMFDIPRTLKVSHAEGGGPFSPERKLNDDGKEVNTANFSAIATGPDGRIFAAWLDRRNEDPEFKQVFMAASEDGGRTFGENYLISDSACPCCRPDIAFLDGGKTVVVTYRQDVRPSDYSNPAHLRDHLMIRSTDGGETFSDPVLISDDGWVASFCPGAGIAIDVDTEDRIHAVWWTGGRKPDEAGIYHTYSENGGKSFAPRQLISEATADTVLHTQVAVDENDTVYAIWQGVLEDRAQLFLAHSRAGTGEWSQIYRVNDSTWNSFYPMVTVDDEKLYVAWTERKGEASRVKLRTAPLVAN